MKIFLLTILMISVACTSIDVDDYYTPEEISKRLLQSEKVIAMRQQRLEGVSLHYKALFFEEKLTGAMSSKWKFCPKVFLKNKVDVFRMDMTALFLASMAFKFAVTKEEIDKTLILNILDSIYAADTLNKLDGFLPYKVSVKRGELKIISNETHINVYTQLFFAYISLLEMNKDSQIRQRVLRHLKLVINHLQANDFKLVDQEGQEAEYSDISPSFFAMNGSRKCALMALLDAGLNYFPDEGFSEKLKSARTQISDYGYEEDIQSLHFKVFNLELPTHSSSWLNMLSFYNGFRTTEAEHYVTAYKNLLARYADEQNVFFLLIGQLIHEGRNKAVLEGLKQKLEDFPVNPANSEIVFDDNKGIALSEKAVYVKNIKRLEALSPLPFYRRPLKSFEWKQNQMRVDGNFTNSGNQEYTGIDYLLAYWMLIFISES